MFQGINLERKTERPSTVDTYSLSHMRNDNSLSYSMVPSSALGVTNVAKFAINSGDDYIKKWVQFRSPPTSKYYTSIKPNTGAACLG